MEGTSPSDIGAVEAVISTLFPSVDPLSEKTKDIAYPEAILQVTEGANKYYNSFQRYTRQFIETKSQGIVRWHDSRIEATERHIVESWLSSDGNKLESDSGKYGKTLSKANKLFKWSTGDEYVALKKKELALKNGRILDKNSSINDEKDVDHHIEEARPNRSAIKIKPPTQSLGNILNRMIEIESNNFIHARIQQIKAHHSEAILKQISDRKQIDHELHLKRLRLKEEEYDRELEASLQSHQKQQGFLSIFGFGSSSNSSKQVMINQLGDVSTTTIDSIPQTAPSPSKSKLSQTTSSPSKSKSQTVPSSKSKSQTVPSSKSKLSQNVSPSSNTKLSQNVPLSSKSKRFSFLPTFGKFEDKFKEKESDVGEIETIEGEEDVAAIMSESQQSLHENYSEDFDDFESSVHANKNETDDFDNFESNAKGIAFDIKSAKGNDLTIKSAKGNDFTIKSNTNDDFTKSSINTNDEFNNFQSSINTNDEFDNFQSSININDEFNNFQSSVDPFSHLGNLDSVNQPALTHQFLTVEDHRATSPSKNMEALLDVFATPSPKKKKSSESINLLDL